MQTIDKKVVSDGVYPLNNLVLSAEINILLSGDDGGAVFTIVYYDRDGAEVPYVGADDLPFELVVGTQDAIRQGANQKVYLKVSGATGATSVNVLVTPSKGGDLLKELVWIPLLRRNSLPWLKRLRR